MSISYRKVHRQRARCDVELLVQYPAEFAHSNLRPQVAFVLLKKLSCTFYNGMWGNHVAAVGQSGKVEQAMLGQPFLGNYSTRGELLGPQGAPLLIHTRGYLLRSFPQVDTSAIQRGFEIRVFPLLGELPKTIKSHLPVCQLYHWQLGPNMLSSPTTKSFDPIIVTAHRVGIPGKATDPPHVELPAIVRRQCIGQRRRQGYYIIECMWSV